MKQQSSFRAGMAALLASVVLPVAHAQTSPIGLCTGGDCGYCPSQLTTTGTGYPACVVYDRDTVLGGYADDYEDGGVGKKTIYYDIAEQTNPTCRTIVRTPANVDDTNCGAPVYAGKGGVCVSISTSTTFMVQFCCGLDDCESAGAEKRDISSSISSLVLKHENGDLVLPHSVGHAGIDMMDIFMEDHGINKTTLDVASKPRVVQIGYDQAEDKHVEKRDCDSYDPDGAPFSRLGSESFTIGNEICDATMQTVMNTQGVSRTMSFDTSVGDPFGIISETVGFSFEENASQSFSYSFTPPDDSCGHVTWTPIFRCTSGTLNGCGGAPAHGDACTAKRISDNELDGVYRFTVTS